MRGDETQQGAAFSYVSKEERTPRDHPVRSTRRMADEVLERMGTAFEALCSWTGPASIPPERLLRALLLQALHTIRSERLLMEQLDYNLLSRWFVAMDTDEKVWMPKVSAKNRESLLVGEVAAGSFAEAVALARQKRPASDEHFTADGTMIEAWAGQKSFRSKDDNLPKGQCGDLRDEKRSR